MDEAMDKAQPDRPWEGRGWLIQYLVEGDGTFGHRRLHWWMLSAVTGQLPADAIPPITFSSSRSAEVRTELVGLSDYLMGVNRKDPKAFPLSPHGAICHLRGLCADATDFGLSQHEALCFLIRYLAWGLQLTAPGDRPWQLGSHQARYAEHLYRALHLGRLQAADCDLFGDLLSEFGHQGAAFYPTPMEVCNLMFAMVQSQDATKDARLESCCDPCVGTGRMLLAASNMSCNLYGADIDGLLVNACAVNMALFAPWAVYQSAAQRAMLSRPRSTLAGDQRIIESIDVTRQAQGYEPLPSSLVELDGVTPEGDPLPCAGETQRVYDFDRHGQGELFSVPAKKAS